MECVRNSCLLLWTDFKVLLILTLLYREEFIVWDKVVDDLFLFHAALCVRIRH